MLLVQPLQHKTSLQNVSTARCKGRGSSKRRLTPETRTLLAVACMLFASIREVTLARKRMLIVFLTGGRPGHHHARAI